MSYLGYLGPFIHKSYFFWSLKRQVKSHFQPYHDVTNFEMLQSQPLSHNSSESALKCWYSDMYRNYLWGFLPWAQCVSRLLACWFGLPSTLSLVTVKWFISASSLSNFLFLKSSPKVLRDGSMTPRICNNNNNNTFYLHLSRYPKTQSKIK